MPSTKNLQNHRQLPPHLVSDPSTRKQKVHIFASASFDTYTTLLIYCSLLQFHNADAGPYKFRHLHVVVTGSCYFDLVVRITRTVVSHAILQSAYRFRFQSLSIKFHIRVIIFCYPHAFFSSAHGYTFNLVPANTGSPPPQYNTKRNQTHVYNTPKNTFGSWNL